MNGLVGRVVVSVHNERYGGEVVAVTYDSGDWQLLLRDTSTGELAVRGRAA